MQRASSTRDQPPPPIYTVHPLLALGSLTKASRLRWGPTVQDPFLFGSFHRDTPGFYLIVNSIFCTIKTLNFLLLIPVTQVYVNNHSRAALPSPGCPVWGTMTEV